MCSNINCKWPVCPPAKMMCVKMVEVSDNDCLNKCDGLFITGVDTKEFEQDQVKDILSKVNDDYEKYKTGRNIEYLSSIGGMYLTKIKLSSSILVSSLFLS